MPIRVVHLPVIIANNAIALSKYLNRIGVESKTISYFRTWLNYEGNINLELDSIPFPERHQKVRTFVEDFIKNEAHKYDVFHCHFFDTLSTGMTFGGWRSHPEQEIYWDLKVLKDLGKKIIVSSWGSDVRNNSKIIYYQLKFEAPHLDLPYPPLNTKKQYLKIWKFSQYADAMINGDSETLKHMPFGTMIPIGIDLEPFQEIGRECLKNSSQFSILYAPSNTLYKGSKYTKKILDRITAKYGDRIEIRKIHGLPYKEAIKQYPGFGIAVDDINFSFGLFALEAMALGRTVFCSRRDNEFVKNDPKLIAPVVSVFNEEDFFNRMVDFIENPNRMNPPALEQFVTEHFSGEVIADQYKKMYEMLLSEEKIPSLVSQDWMKEFDRFIQGKKIDQNDYYPKVTDLLLQRRDMEKLSHEIQMGFGLNNDLELLAKYIFYLEVTGQNETIHQLKNQNANAVASPEFDQQYSRAKALFEGGSEAI